MNIPYSSYPSESISLCPTCEHVSSRRLFMHVIMIYLGILVQNKAFLLGCLREPKARQTQCNDIKAGMVRRCFHQQRQNLSNLDEIPRPYKKRILSMAIGERAEENTYIHERTTTESHPRHCSSCTQSGYSTSQIPRRQYPS